MWAYNCRCMLSVLIYVYVCAVHPNLHLNMPDLTHALAVTLSPNFTLHVWLCSQESLKHFLSSEKLKNKNKTRIFLFSLLINCNSQSLCFWNYTHITVYDHVYIIMLYHVHLALLIMFCTFDNQDINKWAADGTLGSMFTCALVFDVCESIECVSMCV